MARCRFAGRLLVCKPMVSCAHRALPGLWPLLGAVALLPRCRSKEIVYKYRSAIFKHVMLPVRRRAPCQNQRVAVIDFLVTL